MIATELVCGVPVPRSLFCWRPLAVFMLATSPVDWRVACEAFDTYLRDVADGVGYEAAAFARDKAVSNVGFEGCDALAVQLFTGEEV